MLAFEAGWDFFLDAIAPVLRFDDRPIVLRVRVRTLGARVVGEILEVLVEEVREQSDVSDSLDDVRPRARGGHDDAGLLESGHRAFPRVRLAGVVQSAVLEPAVQALAAGKLLMDGTGGRGSGVGREGYRVSRLFQFDWKVRGRTTALGPTISSASSTSALADLTCSGGIARTTSRPASVSTLARTEFTAPSWLPPSGMVARAPWDAPKTVPRGIKRGAARE